MQFAPKNIYNCDEIGISTAQTLKKIQTIKCRVESQVGKGKKTLTLMCYAGGFISAMFIFLQKDGPTRALYKDLDNGWINENFFLK